MSNDHPNVVIDTQVWVFVFQHETLSVEGFDSKQPYRAILEALEAGEFAPVFAPETLDELEYILTQSTVVARKFNLDTDLASRFIEAISSTDIGAVMVDIDRTLKVCSDEDDDCFVEAAIAGKARYLVSEDAHLHEDAVRAELRKHDIRVVYPRQFRKALAERSAHPIPMAGEPVEPVSLP